LGAFGKIGRLATTGKIKETSEQRKTGKKRRDRRRKPFGVAKKTLNWAIRGVCAV
jgi:hypothetical protein